MGTNPTPDFNSRLKFCIEPVMTDKSTESEHLPIDRWLEWARRDDWHAYFVGSDIRQMLGEIERLREKTLRDYSDGDIAGEFHYRASLAKADEDGKRLAKEIDDYVDSHLAERRPLREWAEKRAAKLGIPIEELQERDVKAAAEVEIDSEMEESIFKKLHKLTPEEVAAMPKREIDPEEARRLMEGGTIHHGGYRRGLESPEEEDAEVRRMLTMPVTDEQIDEVDKVLEAARPLVECPTCMRRFKLGEHCDLPTCSLMPTDAQPANEEWDFCKRGKKWGIYPKSAVSDGIDWFIADADSKADAEKIVAALNSDPKPPAAAQSRCSAGSAKAKKLAEKYERILDRAKTMRRTSMEMRVFEDDMETIIAALRALNAPQPVATPAFDAMAAEVIDRISERYNKLAASPLGMATAWERKASGGKPLLYGGKRGLLASGTIATWDEFDLIADVINNLPTLLAACSVTRPQQS